MPKNMCHIIGKSKKRLVFIFQLMVAYSVTTDIDSLSLSNWLECERVRFFSCRSPTELYDFVSFQNIRKSIFHLEILTNLLSNDCNLPSDFSTYHNFLSKFTSIVYGKIKRKCDSFSLNEWHAFQLIWPNVWTAPD